MANPSELFVVVAYGGEFDDAWESNCIGTFDEQKAKDYIVEEQKDDAQHNEWVKKSNDFECQYREENPFPRWFHPKKLPHWQGVKKHQITPEMQAAKDAIIAENEADRLEIERLHREWYDQYREALSAFLTTLGVPDDQFEIYFGYVRARERSFRIEKLKLI